MQNGDPKFRKFLQIEEFLGNSIPVGFFSKNSLIQYGVLNCNYFFQIWKTQNREKSKMQYGAQNLENIFLNLKKIWNIMFA